VRIMKKSVLLLAAMYLYLFVPTAVFFGLSNENDQFPVLLLTVLGTCFILLIVAGIFNLVSAVELFRKEEYNKLRSEMLLLKLGFIPFFVAEYAIFIAMALGFSFLAVFFIWTVVGPVIFIMMVVIAAVMLYTIMLISSVYGIAFVSLLRKEKIISTGMLILYNVFQLIPVADLIITIVLLSKYRKE